MRLLARLVLDCLEFLWLIGSAGTSFPKEAAAYRVDTVYTGFGLLASFSHVISDFIFTIFR